MDVSGLKALLRQDTFPSFFIFSGSEWKVQQLYIQQMAKVAHLEIKHIDSIADIYSKKGNKSFINKYYLYVVRDDKEITTNEKIQSHLDTIIGDNKLVLLLTNVDKRTKFYKAYKDSIIDFEPLKPEILKRYIQKEVPLSDDSCVKLMEICEYDYGRCLLEIDKIKQYRLGYGKNDIFDNDAFRMLLEEGTIYTPPKDAIFEFVDAILDRDVAKVYDLYEQCKAVNEATMVMLTVLYNNAKAVLQVQSCNSGDVGKSTGLTGWQIMNAKKHLKRYAESELKCIINLCYRCQKGIVSGTLDEQFAMDYLLASIL